MADGGVELLEGDVFAIVGQDPVVCHGVEHGAGGAGVAGSRGDIGWPVAEIAWTSFWHDPVGIAFGEDEV